MGCLSSWSFFIHLLELVDESILEVELPQVVAVGALLVEDFANVAGFNMSRIGAHGDALVINLLLIDPGGEKHI